MFHIQTWTRFHLRKLCTVKYIFQITFLFTILRKENRENPFKIIHNIHSTVGLFSFAEPVSMLSSTNAGNHDNFAIL